MKQKIFLKVVVIMLLICSVFMILPSNVNAEDEIVNSLSVNHTHAGNTTAGGGCYTVPQNVQVGTTPTYARCESCGHEGGNWMMSTRTCTECHSTNVAICGGTPIYGTRYAIGCGLDNSSIVATINMIKNRSASEYSLSILASNADLKSFSWDDNGTAGGTAATEQVTGFGVYTCNISYEVEGITHTEALTYEVTDFDNIPPEVTLSYDDATWSQTKLITVAEATDNSALAESAFRFFDGANWSEWGVSQEWEVSGNTTYSVEVRDIYENVNHQDIVITHIDRTVPSIVSITCDNSQYSKERIISVVAEDTESGVCGYSFSMDGTNWSEWSSQSTCTVKSNCKVYARVKDNAGNITESNDSTSIEVSHIDNNPPAVISISVSPDGWNKEKTVSVSAWDDGAGVAGYAYSLDGTNWVSGGSTYTVNQNCTVYVSVSDHVGNTSLGSIEVKQIDNEAPTLAGISFSPDGWSKDKTVIVSAQDGGSGIEGYSYSLDGTKWVSGGNTYTVNQNCTVYVSISDHVGNTVLGSIEVNQIDISGPDIIIAGKKGWVKQCDIFVSALDEESGVAALAYAFSTDGINWGDWQESGTYLASQSGKVYVKVRDNLNNITGEDFNYFYEATIDNQAPEITIESQNRTIVVTAMDDHDLKAYAFSTDGENWSEWQESNSYLLQGENIVYVRVVDNAGNISEATYEVVMIDIVDTPRTWSIPTEIAVGTSSSAVGVFGIVFLLFGFGNTKLYTITASGRKKFIRRAIYKNNKLKFSKKVLKKTSTNKIIILPGKQVLAKHSGEWVEIICGRRRENMILGEQMEFDVMEE